MTNKPKGYQPTEGVLDPTDPPKGGSGFAVRKVTMTPEETIEMQAELIAAAEEIIKNQEAQIKKAHRSIIRLIALSRSMRAALDAAKAWIEDEDRDGLSNAYEDGIIGYCHYVTDEQGNIEYDCNGKPYLDDNVADYKDVIAEMNKGSICWDPAEIENYPALTLWMQIWKALNPGREFKTLEVEEKP